MQVLHGLEEMRARYPGLVATIGNFDGVHLGHQALFARCLERSRAIGGTAMAVTFEPHPMRVLRPAVNLPLITPLEQKLLLIEACGLDVCLCMRFDENLARLSADAFVDKLLVGRLGVCEVVVGYDFAFGHKGLGDVELLSAKGKAAGFSVRDVGPVMVDGRPASSTRVRQSVRAGDMPGAMRLLGRNYRLAGEVVSGQGRGGRLLGFPTANLKVSDELLPALGVYAVMVQGAGPELLPGVTNVGKNPTFSDGGMNVETHLLDFEGDLYGRHLTLHFVERLRAEMRFSGPQELAEQIARDCQAARALLAGRR